MRLLALVLSLTMLAAAGEKSPKTNSFHDLTAKSIDGKSVSLSRYKGKVALVVNTASKCGLTPQYKALQAIHDRYASRGFTVLGFPSNDFRSQEPASNAEIKKFCELNYGVNFPLFEKRPVTGPETQPVFKFLKQSPVGHAEGEITWNFAKFLVDRNGRVIARYSPKTAPDSPEISAKIEELLAR
jgi:glutathione peroxidase